MTDRHTLPGEWPGLLRRCSPVLAVWGEESIADDEYSASGVVLSILAADSGVLVANCGWDGGDPDQSCALDTLHLDLTDPTGQQHAALWAWPLFSVADLTDTEEDNAHVLLKLALRGQADPAALHALCWRLHGETDD